MGYIHSGGESIATFAEWEKALKWLVLGQGADEKTLPSGLACVGSFYVESGLKRLSKRQSSIIPQLA